jgi:hypothetical protein
MHNIFTEPDEDIFQEVNSDPLGIRVIWSDYGRRIFGSKITTVATDIRNYTLNLFHHWIIKEFIGSNPELYTRTLNNFKVLRTREMFVDGLLMYLEDIWVHSMYTAPDNDVDKGAVLGISKASEFHNNGKTIDLEIDPNAGILVRQRGLGVNGRYKGPFTAMDIMTRSYTYTNNWDDINSFFSKKQDFQRLQELIIGRVKSILQKKKNKEQWFDIVDESQEIIQLYRSCFGKHQEIAEKSKEIWIKLLGFDQGAAGELFSIVNISKESGVEDIIKQALSGSLSDKEKGILKDVLLIEPFLVWATKFFEAIQYIKHKNVGQIVEYVKNDLEQFKQALLLDLESLSEPDRINARLAKMIAVFKNNTIENAIPELLKYHTQVMKERDAFPWVEVDGDRIIHSTPGNSLEDYDRKEWKNNYYIFALMSFCRGFKNNEAV